MDMHNRAVRELVERYAEGDRDFNGFAGRNLDLSGIDLSGANLFYAILADSDLRGANLAGAYLEGAYLRRANLMGVNLTGADLSGADLSGVVLTDAILPNLPIPIVFDLDRKVAEAVLNKDCLDMETWHGYTCSTVHCRGGWAIHLAGKDGYALEVMIDSCAAAALIYHVSTGYVPNFFANNTDAMADILERVK
jgi:hypothetical protein